MHADLDNSINENGFVISFPDYTQPVFIKRTKQRFSISESHSSIYWKKKFMWKMFLLEYCFFMLIALHVYYSENSLENIKNSKFKYENIQSNKKKKNIKKDSNSVVWSLLNEAYFTLSIFDFVFFNSSEQNYKWTELSKPSKWNSSIGVLNNDSPFDSSSSSDWCVRSNLDCLAGDGVPLSPQSSSYGRNKTPLFFSLFTLLLFRVTWLLFVGNLAWPKLLLSIFVIENAIGVFGVCWRADNLSCLARSSRFSCLIFGLINDGNGLHSTFVAFGSAVVVVTGVDVTGGGAIDISCSIVKLYIRNR